MTQPILTVDQGRGARAAGRVFGLWVIGLIGAWVIWLSAEFFDERPVPMAFFLVISVLFAPACGFAVYRAARNRNQHKGSRGARTASVIALAFNVITVALMLLMADGLKHMR